MDKCKVCSNEFKRKYPRGGHKKIYCSKKCRYSDGYIERTCLTCLKKFKRHFLAKKVMIEYCSLACIQRYPCQLCGEIIMGRIYFQGGSKRFCTRKCSNFFHRTLHSKIAYVPKAFSQTIKKYGKIICERCRIEDISMLCVHHKDSNNKNNALDNLETLCANCHLKEHIKDSVNREKHVMLAYMLAKM